MKNCCLFLLFLLFLLSSSTLTYAQDVTPPQIVSFSFCPTAIDTTKGNAIVYVTIAARDDLSGVQHLGAVFRSPSGAQSIGGGFEADGTLVSGTQLDGSFRTQFTFPQFSEQGPWSVQLINSSDRVGNNIVLNTDTLNARGFSTRLTVQAGSPSVSCPGALSVTADCCQGPGVTGGRSATAGQIVPLRGSVAGSQNQNLSFVWTQIQGPTVSLTNANGAIATFTAPQVATVTDLKFKLTVSDGSQSADAFVVLAVYPAASTVPPLPPVTDQTTFFPHLANGQGMTTDIVLTNPSSATVTGRFELYSDSGQLLPVAFRNVGTVSIAPFTIPAYGEVTLSTDGQGPAVQGFARIISAGNVGGVLRFTIPGIGIAGVQIAQPLSGGIVPVRLTADGINTGIAIANTSGNGATATLTLRNSLGAVMATAIVSVPANGHTAKFINEFFPSVNGTLFDGTLTFTTTGEKLSIVALEMGNAPGQFTTLPVTPLL